MMPTLRFKPDSIPIIFGMFSKNLWRHQSILSIAKIFEIHLIICVNNLTTTRVKQSKNLHKNYKLNFPILKSYSNMKVCIVQRPTVKDKKTPHKNQHPNLKSLLRITQVFPLLTEEVSKLGESLPYCTNLMTSIHSLKISPKFSTFWLPSLKLFPGKVSKHCTKCL